VIRGVSVEILTSRIGCNSLGHILGIPLSRQEAKMIRWLNKWIVPLLVAVVMLVALAIAALVSFGVHLLH
jgi:hypothetical protein